MFKYYWNGLKLFFTYFFELLWAYSCFRNWIGLILEKKKNKKKKSPIYARRTSNFWWPSILFDVCSILFDYKYNESISLNMPRLSSSIHTSTPSLRLFPSYFSRNTLNLSLYSQFIPSSLTFPSISLKSSIKIPRPRSSVIALALKTLAETESVAVPEDSNQLNGKFPSETGVYAVFDSNGDLQFVGLSRNIAASVLAHRKSVPVLCHSVKVYWIYDIILEFCENSWLLDSLDDGISLFSCDILWTLFWLSSILAFDDFLFYFVFLLFLNLWFWRQKEATEWLDSGMLLLWIRSHLVM